VYLIEKTIEFDKCLKKLRDKTARAKIIFRLQRFESGNLGDVKPVSHGITEMRIPHGKGYRIYYKIVEKQVVLLLIGGDKSTQEKDIEKAKKIWDNYQKQEL
jgi:putative addiction module killer protein